MSEPNNLAASLLALYGLSEPPSAQEIGVAAIQLARIAAMLETRLSPPGALFEAAPSTYRSALERLADEKTR